MTGNMDSPSRPLCDPMLQKSTRVRPATITRTLAGFTVMARQLPCNEQYTGRPPDKLHFSNLWRLHQ
eukprot:9593342-Lingulodinium_polyedra.AAC.1